MYPYGLIGNCETSALVSLDGSLDWLCWPRPDSHPVFGKLLDKNGGYFSIRPAGQNWQSRQTYISNTNVLRTEFTLEDGSSFRVIDFCPRYEQYGRVFHPHSIVRIVEPTSGNPSICVNIEVIDGWDKNIVKPTRSNTHLRYEIRGEQMRLTTNMPLIYLESGIPHGLTDPVYFALNWGSGTPEDLISLCREQLDKTVRYWRTWVKHCSIPTLFQKEVIRSALALKLHCYEDTGAILAATTTSLPEEPNHNRNWDYRYCWLRDAAFVVSAFQNLGHFEEMEGFLKFILNVLHKHEYTHEKLSPVYALDLSRPVPETEHPNWEGFAGARPVRSQNQAADHIQNDIYGELVLALAPVFFDERFEHLRDGEHEELLEKMVRHCMRYISKPDAGLWEIRGGWQEHSFSNLMCWAGLNRAATLRANGFLRELEPSNLHAAMKRAEEAVCAAEKEKAIRNGPHDPTFDSSLLLMPLLRFTAINVEPTVRSIHENLIFDPQYPAFLYRYRRQDDFGTPKSAFVICSFWLAQAYAKLGEIERAKDIVHQTLMSANHVGLFAEHFLPAKKLQLGNFPQAYSHVGLINAAFMVSPQWHEVI